MELEGQTDQQMVMMMDWQARRAEGREYRGYVGPDQLAACHAFWAAVLLTHSAGEAA